MVKITRMLLCPGISEISRIFNSSPNINHPTSFLYVFVFYIIIFIIVLLFLYFWAFSFSKFFLDLCDNLILNQGCKLGGLHKSILFRSMTSCLTMNIGLICFALALYPYSQCNAMKVDTMFFSVGMQTYDLWRMEIEYAVIGMSQDVTNDLTMVVFNN